MKTGCKQMKRALCGSIPLAMALFAGLVGISVAQTPIYDFEALEVNKQLQGQDGWLSTPDLGEIIVRQDATAANGSQVVEPVLHLSSGWPAFLTRVNDEGFGYSPFFGSETEVVMEFDTNGEATSGFALGRDLDGDGLLAWESGELGPAFGTLRDMHSEGIERFVVTGASLGSYHFAEFNGGDRCCNADSDWYRLQFRMDLSANSGAGSGDLYYMNLTRGDTEFQPIAELQDVALGLDSMHPDAGPESWNAIWLALFFDGSFNMPRGDNLVPRIPAVLESHMTLSLQSVDAQAVLGASYDAELIPVRLASDPTGLYWGLNQVALAHPGAASAGTLLSNLDLVLEDVDIYAVFPELGTISSACLRYQGEVGEPRRMTWGFDPQGCD